MSAKGHVIEWVFDPELWMIAAAIFAVLCAAYALQTRHRAKPADPLSGLFNPTTFDAEVQATERRQSNATPSNAQRTAILRARIDSKSKKRALWDSETRAEAVSQVAQVMRASVRDGDRVQAVQGPEGDDSFVIIAPGADEEEASGIAKRLLERIAETRMRGNASFGVAQQREGESDAETRARAGDAMEAAARTDSDQVVMASEWEEILLLPAPTPSEEQTSKNAAKAETFGASEAA